ncbi:Mobile element protein [hydrothermal vent metagenome]|uniref:Mobile element protein n=1 Tax=hydrothermal vent metagenome TaxID=652676 RepID=A0A3B0Z2D5_9ZZZZ
MSSERKNIIERINEARDSGARQDKACEVVGLSAKTFQRWVQSDNEKDNRIEPNHEPKNKLTEWERQRVLKVANSPEYAHLPPSQIVPGMADKGEYIASESTFYRLLNENKQLKHRDKSKPARTVIQPKALTASAPNQIYSWDITYLPSPVKGAFFYLYLVLDIYSRKIVGWQIHNEERSALSADLMIDICQRENIERNQVTLHSDNGSPMKGATMLATLQELGVVPSFSRPSVSNDNPYSESLFRTLKYRPEYPEKAFVDIRAARDWVSGFAQWYNEEHRHSGIKFVTPGQRHRDDDIQILAKRKQVYEQARSQNPSRWTGKTRNWDRIDEVYLNPGKGQSEVDERQAA